MSFWQSELGEVTGSAEDAFSRPFVDVIPNGTKALAKIKTFYNETNDKTGFKCLAIDWELINGEFKGMFVRQRIRVIDSYPGEKDPAKSRHRALNMLKLIYKLFNVQPKHSNVPTDDDLRVFDGKTAGIVICERKPNDEGKIYNYVSEVHGSQGFKSETGTILTVTHTRNGVDSAFNRNPSGLDESLTDDVPF